MKQTGGSGESGSAREPAGERPKRKRHWVRWTAAGLSVALLATAATGWWLYRKLDGNITTDTTAAAELKTYGKERPTPVVLNAENILLIGSDTRAGKGNGKYGQRRRFTALGHNDPAAPRRRPEEHHGGVHTA